jgi:hypothetical protein
MNWFEKAVLAPYCAPAWISQGAASVVENRGAYEAPPIPPAPSVALTSAPDAQNQPGAVYAGDAADGTPVYAVPETSGENMARFKTSVTQFFNEQGERTPPTDFMSQYGTYLAVGGAIVGALLLLNATGGRR